MVSCEVKGIWSRGLTTYLNLERLTKRAMNSVKEVQDMKNREQYYDTINSTEKTIRNVNKLILLDYFRKDIFLLFRHHHLCPRPLQMTDFNNKLTLPSCFFFWSRRFSCRWEQNFEVKSMLRVVKNNICYQQLETSLFSKAIGIKF